MARDGAALRGRPGAHSWAFCLLAPAEPTLIWPVSGRPRPGGGEVLGNDALRVLAGLSVAFVFLKHGVGHARRGAAGVRYLGVVSWCLVRRVPVL